MSLINKALYNYLNDICEQPRYACYVKNNILIVYIQGGENLKYNPATDEIIILEKYSAGLVIKKSQVDKSILQKIYKKLTKTEEESEDSKLKKKYGIASNRRLTEKQRAEIAKYQARLKETNSGGDDTSL